MSVKITESFYINGMPNMDYSIDINGVIIGLKKDDFKELIEKLDEKLKIDYQKASEVKEKYDKNIRNMRQLKREIIEIFWDGNQEDSDSMFFRRKISEIDQEKLWKTLEKYDELLGLR